MTIKEICDDLLKNYAKVYRCAGNDLTSTGSIVPYGCEKLDIRMLVNEIRKAHQDEVDAINEQHEIEKAAACAKAADEAKAACDAENKDLVERTKKAVLLANRTIDLLEHITGHVDPKFALPA